MKLGPIALAATALLFTVGAASAQSSTTSSGVGGTLCSDLLALDTTSQGAFLQGYQAAMQDELVTAGAGVGATGMSSSSALSGTASTLGSGAAGGTASFDSASIISNCNSSPTTPLSQILSSSGTGAATGASAQ